MKFIKKGAGHFNPHLLVSLLHSELTNVSTERRYDTVHLSDLTNETKEFCPRERAIRIRDNDDLKVDEVTTATRVTFDLGNAIHDLVRDRWLRAHAWGNWKCGHCNHKYLHVKDPGTCKMCGSPDLRYREVTLYWADKHVVGNVDFFVYIGKQLYVVEIKSIGPDNFKTISAPYSEHRIRTQAYLHMAVTSGLPVCPDKALVLYVVKSGWGVKDPVLMSSIGEMFSPFKVFEVRADPKAAEDLLNGDDVRALDEWRQNWLEASAPLLPDRICKTPKDARAKKCPAMERCFT